MEARKKDYKGHYAAHWMVLTAIAAVPLVYHWSQVQAPVLPRLHPQAARPSAPRVNWFFLLKMPEITTQYESGVDTMKERLTETFMQLRREGFHPMLFSDVQRALQRGEGVPERTVVTFFSPGYRHTYEIVNPILSSLRWPALWLTDGAGMRHSDRRFVTYHTTRQMKDSGLWDVGFQENNGRHLSIESAAGRSFSFGSSAHTAWSAQSGAFSLNRGAATEGGLRFLTVNSSWTPPELVNRLNVEMPPTGDPIYLTKGVIQGREWGLTVSADRVQAPPVFDLKPPLNRRGTKLFFLGTQGIHDFQLHVECRHLVGEFWAQLRADEMEGYAINVILTDRAIFVVQQVQREKTRLFGGPHVASKGNEGFVEDITLQGDQLSVSINKGEPLVVTDLGPPDAGKGTLQIYVADKPHGTARADGLTLTFTPLPAEPPSPQTVP